MLHLMIVRWFYVHCPQSSLVHLPAPGCPGLCFATRKGDRNDYLGHYRAIKMVMIMITMIYKMIMMVKNWQKW